MSLTLILGCMFSGKTEELMRRVGRYRAIGWKVLVVNSAHDTRCGAEVQSHAGEVREAVKTYNLDNISLVEDSVQVIAVDEAQFFSDLAQVVTLWVDTGMSLCLVSTGTFKAIRLVKYCNWFRSRTTSCGKGRTARCVATARPPAFPSAWIKRTGGNWQWGVKRSTRPYAESTGKESTCGKEYVVKNKKIYFFIKWVSLLLAAPVFGGWSNAAAGGTMKKTKTKKKLSWRGRILHNLYRPT